MERKRDGESERLRDPQPLIKKRIASGRGAMEQPNVTNDGDARLSPQFWAAVVVTGLATGLFAVGLMWVLKSAEHLAFGYDSGSLQNAIQHVSPLHRIVSLLVASVIGSTCWYLIRRFLKSERSEIDDALWNGDGELSVRRSALTSVVSEVVIGMGASAGREAAPKLMGGASGSIISRWLALTPAQKRLLVACGGGAGLAAVYNVPLGGAIFTAEVLYGSFALPVVMPALVTSLLATMTAWLYLGRGATYTDIPAYRFSATLMVWSLIAGVLIGLLSVFYVRLIGWVSHYRANGANIFWAMPTAFLLLGVIVIWYPHLFANGKDLAHQAFLGIGGTSVFFALFALKPFVTATTLGSGTAGGVFTPFMATGATLGAFLGAVWIKMWPGSPVGAFALIGAAAMIGASMQAPLAGLVLIMELTHSGFSIMIPMMAATVIATYLVRQIDGYSIYSARLPRHVGPSVAPPPPVT